jgi:Fe-S cluster assembly protein SufD
MKDARSARWAELDRGPAPAWLRAARQAAFERFTGLGFPTTRLEAWRHTDVTPIARAAFAAPAADGAHRLADAAARVALGGLGGPVLVFVNGRYASQLSNTGALQNGVRLESLALAWGEKDTALVEAHAGREPEAGAHAFTALNRALAEDGALVVIPRGLRLEAPIQLVFVAGPESGTAVESHPRVLVVAAPEAQATIVEIHSGDGDSFTNASTEIVVGDAAAVTHHKIQRASATAFHIARTQARLGRDARFESLVLTFGAALARNEVDVCFDALGGECTLDGLWINAGTQHTDHQTFVDHREGHSTSRQLYKGVLGGTAHGVFNGRVLVRPDAQQTNAQQRNNNLLLSESALVDTKPELEIHADDVRCTHGATIGRLDAQALFYLRSRGLGERAAYEMLVQAFAREVLDRVPDAALRAAYDGLATERLAALATGEATV